jgi:4-amino-4-deoxy-L-arabinose transferase-like glycosyltransferase
MPLFAPFLPIDRSAPLAVGRDRRIALGLVLLLAAALRLYPIHVPYLHPDQEYFPTWALESLVRGDWQTKPGFMEYPTGLLFTLRAAYTVAYGVAKLFGVVATREEFFATWLENPFPFYLAARVWSVLLGVGTVALVARLSDRVANGTGVVAALLLAIAPLHVRESHYGSLDSPATFFFTAALLVALELQRTGRLRAAALGGLLVGLTAAHRYQLAIVALAYPAAEWLRREHSRRGGVGRLAASGLAAIMGFLALNPQAVLDFHAMRRDLAGVMRTVYLWQGPASLSLPQLLVLGAGFGTCLAAALGVPACLRERWRTCLPVLVVALPYAAMVMESRRVFARYTVALLPLVAVFAAAGLRSVARLAPKPLAGLALAGLVLLVGAEPAWRSVSLDWTLAQEDTRWQARRWIADNVPAGATVYLAGSFIYSTLAVPPAAEVAGGIAADAPGQRPGSAFLLKGLSPRMLVVEAPPAGSYVVTFESLGLPMFGLVYPEIRAYLRARADRQSSFTGTSTPAAAQRATYDPTDANYLPLRGFEGVLRPGPDIEVWKVR